MRETEITVQVFNDMEEAKNILSLNGFVQKEEYIIYDEYYSRFSVESLKKMSYKEMISNSILLRKFVRNQTTKQSMVYKDKTVDENGAVLSEEKTSVDISDFEKTSVILAESGLTKWCECLNKTTVWAKDFSFALQEVEGLGSFVEIEEDDGISGLSPEQKTEILKQRALSLGLKTGEDFFCKKNHLLFLNKTVVSLDNFSPIL